jgi:outer membrane immunogenic protein
MFVYRVGAVAGAVLFAVSTASAGEVGPTNWNGLYVGAHVGKAVDSEASVTYLETGNYEAAGTTKSLDTDDTIYGVQAGYLHQFGSFVIGAEGSVSFGEFEGEIKENPPPVGNDYVTRIEGGNIYALTGRAGFAFERFLAYGKAGYAWTDYDFSATFFNKDGPGGTNGTQVRIGKSFDVSGPVYGGGIEFALTENITIGAEYLRYDFDSSDAVTLNTTNSGITTEKVSTDYAIDTVQARVNFKFGGREVPVPLK